MVNITLLSQSEGSLCKNYSEVKTQFWLSFLASETESFLVFLLLFPTGFPIVRGRLNLLHVPKWHDSSCQTVAFPPYRFYPDKKVHVQITVNHINLNDSITVHDAVTSWTESISTKNFTVCAMQSGRKEENFNPFASIDWLAYQGAPPEGLTGTIRMQKWWSGTNCADVTFPKVWREYIFPTWPGFDMIL